MHTASFNRHALEFLRPRTSRSAAVAERSLHETASVERVGQKVAAGELVDIRAVPTSKRTAEQARSLGIQLTSLDDEDKPLDVTIDGADTADLRTFGLVKGGGGALLREKIVAAASETFVVIVDGSKISDGLGVAL